MRFLGGDVRIAHAFGFNEVDVLRDRLLKGLLVNPFGICGVDAVVSVASGTPSDMPKSVGTGTRFIGCDIFANEATVGRVRLELAYCPSCPTSGRSAGLFL